jgi:hypothetical protein
LDESGAMSGAGCGGAGWGLGGTRQDYLEMLGGCGLEEFGTHGNAMRCATYAADSISEHLFQLGLLLGACG